MDGEADVATLRQRRLERDIAVLRGIAPSTTTAVFEGPLEASDATTDAAITIQAWVRRHLARKVHGLRAGGAGTTRN